MRCTRCNGLCVNERDFQTDMLFLRCINCGEQKDVGMITNSAKPTPPVFDIRAEGQRIACQVEPLRDLPSSRRGWTEQQRKAHRETMKAVWEKRIKNGRIPKTLLTVTLDRVAKMSEADREALLTKLERKRDALTETIQAIGQLKQSFWSSCVSTMAQA